MKNSPSVVGATTTPVTRHAPPAPPPSSFSSSGDSPQSCGGYRSSPSSADDSDVCVTPGVSHGQGVQVRHTSDDSRVVDSSLGITSGSTSVITSKPVLNHSGVPPKPSHSGVPPKPNHSAISSKSSNPSNIHTPSNSHPDEDDNASLMIEDDPNDSSFGDIDMSFDMDALEETMKMYD